MSITDPTLALGLNGIDDWSTEKPFIDLIKQARTWRNAAAIVGIPGIEAYQDANGWLTEMPAGVSAVVLTLDGSSRLPVGTYVLTWEGTGTVSVTNGANPVVTDHRIEFTKPLITTSLYPTISSIDTEDPPKNLRLFLKKYEALLDDGEIFNPDFLEVVQDARQLRYMDPMKTNWSTQEEWADRPTPADYTYSWRGMPVDVMVALANKTGTDPYFTLPHLATDEYIREFATYIRDNLNPGLVAYVAYSNELWNFQFGQTVWCYNNVARVIFNGYKTVTLSIGSPCVVEMATGTHNFADGQIIQFKTTGSLPTGITAETEYYVLATGKTSTQLQFSATPGGDPINTSGSQSGTHTLEALNADWLGTHDWPQGTAWISFAAERFVNMAQIIATVFSGQMDRVKRVIETQTANIGVTNEILNAPSWQTNSPGTYVAPYSVADALAVTTYFGGYYSGSTGTETQAYRATHTDEETFDWLKNKYLTESIPSVVSQWGTCKTYADAAGLEMIAYEGGQHIIATGGPGGDFLDFMFDFVRSQQMADVYAALWDAWAEISDGPFMQFTAVFRWTSDGAWGLIEDLPDSNPRSRLLFSRNLSTPSWFGSGGGNHYKPEKTKLFESGGVFDPYDDAGGVGVGGSGQDVALVESGPDAYTLSFDGDYRVLTTAGGKKIKMKDFECVRYRPSA